MGEGARAELYTERERESYIYRERERADLAGGGVREGARVELAVVVDEVGVGKEEEPLCIQLSRLCWRRHPIRHLLRRALTTAALTA